jgi:hypothetical protein
MTSAAGPAGRSSVRGAAEGVLEKARQIHDGYGRSDGTVPGYAMVMSVFGLAAATVAGAARLTGRRPAPLSPYELVCLSLATHKVSRLVTKDPVTSPLRAPFTRFKGSSGDSELEEEVTGRGLHKTVGELVTCPFCIGPWTAMALLTGRTFAPALTRAVTAGFTMVAVSDFLQLAYSAAQQRQSPAGTE